MSGVECMGEGWMRERGMDGWMDGWIDGWMAGRTDVWIDGWMER